MTKEEMVGKLTELDQKLRLRDYTVYATRLLNRLYQLQGSLRGDFPPISESDGELEYHVISEFADKILIILDEYLSWKGKQVPMEISNPYHHGHYSAEDAYGDVEAKLPSSTFLRLPEGYHEIHKSYIDRIEKCEFSLEEALALLRQERRRKWTLKK